MKLTSVFSAIITAVAWCAPPLPAQQPDPFLWLEEVEGERALKWVEAQNAATFAALSRHAAYEPILQRTLQILNAAERIAYPSNWVSTSLSYLLQVVVLATADLGIRHRVSVHRLLKQTVEKQTACARCPAVEPEGKLVQVVIEMPVGDRAVVRSEPPPLQQR
jgi:hypothetical protein